MDVLNPSPALVLPQTMWVCYATIAKHPGATSDEALGLMLPDELRAFAPSDGAHAKRALAALREFGLVRTDSDGLLSSEQTDAAGFLRHLRRQLVSPPSEIAADFDGAPDLRSGLVWLLRQSPFTALHWKSNVQVAMPAGLFANDTRWNGFRYWCTALGFARAALTGLATGDAKGGSQLTVDPTDAVIDVVRNSSTTPLPRGEQIPIDTFMAFLLKELPVLPGHPSANYEGLDIDAEVQLAAVGLALNSAEARGILTMGYQSDPSGVLALPDSGRQAGARYVSTIRIEAQK